MYKIKGHWRSTIRMDVWNVIRASTFCSGMQIIFIHLCHACSNAIRKGRTNAKFTLTFKGLNFNVNTKRKKEINIAIVQLEW